MNKIEETIKEKIAIEKENTMSTENNKVCSKCGNEVLENEKFCGKCETITSTKIMEKLILIIKLKLKPILISAIILFFLSIGIPYLLKGGITDRYLTNNFKDSGFDQFDDIKVKAINIEDLEYKEYSKLVLADIRITENGNTINNSGFLLVNRKNDKVEGFTVNNNLRFLILGICENKSFKSKELTQIVAKYINENGTDFFADNETTEYKNLVKEFSNIIGIDKSRNYVKKEILKQLPNNKSNCTLLFEKESALVKYMCYYETTLEYNSKYPYDENTYNNLLKGYQYEDLKNTLTYLYGPAYSTVTKYNVYDIKTSKFVKGFDSLNEARNYFKVD